MSWLFGILRKNNSAFPRFELDEEFQKVESTNLLLVISKSINSSLIQFPNSNFCAFVGIPILEYNDLNKNLNEKKTKVLEDCNQKEMSGHFVFVKSLANQIMVFNDTLGLRELYYIRKDEQIIFSTRIDLLQKYQKIISLNANEFSSLWLSNFQLSHESVFNEIKRLGPGGAIISKDNNLVINNNKFSKYKISNPQNLFKNEILKYCSMTPENKKISLALSGGIDSRIVLSNLLKLDSNFSCHSIVNEDDKDLEISEILCKSLGINHKIIYRDQRNLADDYPKLLKYYKSIPPSIPVTQLFDFVFYGIDYLRDFTILDGGFGEIYRRQFFKKISLAGYKKFNLENKEKIKSALFAPKPNIFSTEFGYQLNEALTISIEKLITYFDTPQSKSDLSEILDLIAIQYKLPNNFSVGQTIFDYELHGIMPLLQKELLNIGLNIHHDIKSDSKFIKNLIKQNSKQLSKIKLVKNNLLTPFWISDKFVMVKILFDRKFNKSQNFDRYKVIYNSKSFVLDLFNQKQVVENSYLNIGNNKVVEEFFEGDLSKGFFVDWLLTFVLWSKANNIS